MIEREVPNFPTTRRSSLASSKRKIALKQAVNGSLTNGTSARRQRVKVRRDGRRALRCVSKDETFRVEIALASRARCDPSENEIGVGEAAMLVRGFAILVAVMTSDKSSHRVLASRWVDVPRQPGCARHVPLHSMSEPVSGWSRSGLKLAPAARSACDPEPDTGFLRVIWQRKRLGERAGVRYGSCSKLTSHACGSGKRKPGLQPPLLASCQGSLSRVDELPELL
jgi:hypothetical protein